MTAIDAPVSRIDRESVVDSKNSPAPGPSARATPAVGDPPSPPEAPATPNDGVPSTTQPPPPAAASPGHRSRKWLLWAGAVAALVVAGYFLVPWVDTVLNTVSTDDAYVNGHVTMVAPR